MSLFKGLMLDKTNCKYLIDDILKGKVFLGCKKPVYHSIWKRPFLAIGVLLGKSMCVHVLNKQQKQPKGCNKMKQHIIMLYNTRQRLKRELKTCSSPVSIAAFKHIDAILRDELC